MDHCLAKESSGEASAPTCASAPSSCSLGSPGSGRPSELGPAVGGSSASPRLAIFCASIRAVSSSSCRMSSIVRSVHSSCQHQAWRWARSITFRKPAMSGGTGSELGVSPNLPPRQRRGAGGRDLPTHPHRG